MDQKEVNQQITELKKQNKKLKRERIILGIYVILSGIIYSYNNYFYQFFD